MFLKVVTLTALVAFVNAVEYGHHATSYASVNRYDLHDNHYAPQVAHYAAPAVAHYAAPIAHVAQVAHVAHVAPVVHHAPVLHHAPLVHHAPVLLKSHHHEEEYYGHPQYQFKYGVEDHHTGDIKSQEESRDGDVVKGSYSLLQPDGRTRTVHYSSDKHSGFQAHVEYSGHAAHPEVQHKALIAAPVLKAPVYKVPAYPHF